MMMMMGEGVTLSCLVLPIRFTGQGTHLGLNHIRNPLSSITFSSPSSFSPPAGTTVDDCYETLSKTFLAHTSHASAPIQPHVHSLPPRALFLCEHVARLRTSSARKTHHTRNLEDIDGGSRILQPGSAARPSSRPSPQPESPPSLPTATTHEPKHPESLESTVPPLRWPSTTLLRLRRPAAPTISTAATSKTSATAARIHKWWCIPTIPPPTTTTKRRHVRLPARKTAPTTPTTTKPAKHLPPLRLHNPTPPSPTTTTPTTKPKPKRLLPPRPQPTKLPGQRSPLQRPPPTPLLAARPRLPNHLPRPPKPPPLRIPLAKPQPLPRARSYAATATPQPPARRLQQRRRGRGRIPQIRPFRAATEERLLSKHIPRRRRRRADRGYDFPRVGHAGGRDFGRGRGA